MTPRPERAGFSLERLARIDQHLQRRYVEPGKIAGALTLVFRRGELAWCSPLGLADRERGAPMREDTIFRIYSMTKPITSVALMALFEEGHFQLDDPVERWIPEWKDLRVYAAGNHPLFATRPAETRMTVRHLLTHTSGLTYGFMERTNVDRAYRKLGIGTFGKGPGGDLGEMVAGPRAGCRSSSRRGRPGTTRCRPTSAATSWSASPASASTQFLRERVFEPLGMEDTGFFVPAGEGRPLRRLLRPRTAQGAPAPRRPAHERLPARAALPRRGRRPRLDGARLPALLPHAPAAAASSTARASLGRKTIELMTREPPARRRATSRRPSIGMFSEVEQAGHGLRPRLLGPPRPGEGRRRVRGRATPGAARRARSSGSTRERS